jgi:uncharacterized protein YhjY with autotransporter beta-barrel domain
MEAAMSGGSRRLFNWFGIAGVMCAIVQGGRLPDVQAQVLDQAVNNLLANNCQNLLQGAGSGVLAPTLAAACTGGPGATGTGTSAGGGAASVQAAAVSILNRNIQMRLEGARDEGGQSTARASSFAMNPFGLLLPGLGQGIEMSSPMTPTGSASGAGFNFGNQSRWNGLGFFASGVVEAMNREVTTFQDGYKSVILGVTGGVDYRINRQTVAGLAVNYSNTHGDFKNGGDFNTNSIGGTLFGSYLPTDRTFIQMTGGYTNNNYLVGRITRGFIPGIAPGPDRILGGLAGSSSNGDVFSASLLGGYDHPIAGLTIGPRIGFTYTNTHIHDYAETSGGGLGLRYEDQWINSIQSTVGIQAQMAFSTRFAVLVPQANANYIHEFANAQRLLGVSFVEDLRAAPTRFVFQNDAPDRDYFNVGTGLIAVLPNGWQGFMNFRAMLGHAQFDNYAGTFGLRVDL